MDGTTATVVKQFDDFPNFNGAGAAFVNQQYTLEADADKLYLGRNGNTATNVTLIKVTRGTDTGIQELPVKVISNGVIYNLKGQKVNSSYKGIAIKDGKKVLIK